MTGKLVNLNIQILRSAINNRTKTKLLELEQKEKLIDEILTEFSDQNKGNVKKEVLLEQIKILKEIMEKYF